MGHSLFHNKAHQIVGLYYRGQLLASLLGKNDVSSNQASHNTLAKAPLVTSKLALMNFKGRALVTPKIQYFLFSLYMLPDHQPLVPQNGIV